MSTTLDQPETRRLATILSIDIVGFSRASEIDNLGAARHVQALRRLVGDCASQHHGRVFNTAGDGLMLEFPTVADGVAATLAIRDRARAEQGLPAIRLGLHVGDVTVLPNGDLIGAGVNVAARVQQRAAPGEIMTTGDVRSLFASQSEALFTRHRARHLEKMTRHVDLYRLSHPGDAPPPQASFIRRRLMPVGLVALVAILAAVAYFAIFPGSTPTARDAPVPSQPIVAVVPFENLSGDESLQYFSDGVTQEIEYALSRIAGLRVVSRPSTQSASETAARVSPSHTLTGSVRKNGDDVRVAARLALNASGEIVWSQTFERPLSETLAIQDEIAARVARALRIVVPETSRTVSVDPRALELYLRGRDQWSTGSNADGEQVPRSAIADLEEAVRLAPDFARAWVALASAYAQQQNWLVGEAQAAAIAKAVSAADRARRIDPSMGEPYIVLGRFSPLPDWTERGRFFAMAIEAEPGDAYVQMLYAQFWLSQTGEWAAARRILRRAFESDPHSALIAKDYFGAVAETGDIVALERLITENEGTLVNAGVFWISLYAMKAMQGDYAGARVALGKADAFLTRLAGEKDPERLADARAVMHDTMAALESKDPAALQALAERFMRNAKMGQTAALVAIVDLTVIGRIDAAFQIAEELFVRNGFRTSVDTAALEIPFEYPYGRVATASLLGAAAADLQRDPRIWTIFAATGLAQYWLGTSDWPDFCARGDLGYDCRIEAEKAVKSHRVN